jgi:hypothetical protein
MLYNEKEGKRSSATDCSAAGSAFYDEFREGTDARDISGAGQYV